VTAAALMLNYANCATTEQQKTNKRDAGDNVFPSLSGIGRRSQSLKIGARVEINL
jgi:hypothetical protein